MGTTQRPLSLCPLLPSALRLTELPLMGAHFVLSSSEVSRGSWVPKSLRTRWPQPPCRLRDPGTSPSCPTPQTVLPHPQSGVLQLLTAQRPPGGSRGVHSQNFLSPALPSNPSPERTWDPVPAPQDRTSPTPKTPFLSTLKGYYEDKSWKAILVRSEAHVKKEMPWAVCPGPGSMLILLPQCYHSATAVH